MTRGLSLAGMALCLLLASCSGGDRPQISTLVQESAQAPSALLDAAIPQTDLPPQGTRSLFDHLIKEHGTLPFPFKDLVALFSEQGAEQRAPVGILIPDGRSLLKAYADFDRPRTLIGANAQPPRTPHDLGIAFRGRLFMGLTENAHEIEVISYNQAAGRFEFQLVKNYCEGCVPRLVYAKRALCTTCHAGAGPIFSQRPWEETNGNGAIGREIAAIRHARPGDTYMTVPLVQTLSVSQSFQDLADAGDLIPVTQHLWIDGCGPGGKDGTQCRRLLLQLALQYIGDPAGFDENSGSARQLRALQAAHWPQHGIPVDNNSLFSRNPLVDPGYETSWWDKVAGLFRSPGKTHVKHAEETPNSLAGLSAFEDLPQLRQALDPLTPRPPKRVVQATDLDGVYGIAALFMPGDDAMLLRAANNQPDRLAAALDGEHVAALLGPQPFSRNAMLTAILLDLHAKTIPKSEWTDVSGMSAPIVDGVAPLEISQGSVLNDFHKYCFGCHRGNPNAKLDFMSGKTEAEVLTHIKAKHEISERLDYARYLGTDKENKLMPPANSYQRRMLDQARKAGKPDVKNMVSVIPGLFDF